MLKQPHANFKKMKSFMPKPINATQRPSNALREKILARRPGGGGGLDPIRTTMPIPNPIGQRPTRPTPRPGGGGLVRDPIRSIMPIPNPRPRPEIGARPMPKLGPGGAIGARPMPMPRPGFNPIKSIPLPNPRQSGGIQLDPREWGGGGGFPGGGRSGRDIDPGFRQADPWNGKDLDPGFISDYDPWNGKNLDPGFQQGGIQLDPREWGGGGGFPGHQQDLQAQLVSQMKQKRMMDLFRQQPRY